MGPYSQVSGLLLVGSIRSHGSLFYLWDLRDLRDLETQDKTRPKKVRVMLTARQTMSDWDKLRWEEAHFPEKKTFPFKFFKSQIENFMMKSMNITIRNATYVWLLLLVPVGDHSWHFAPYQFRCISEIFSSQFQHPCYSKIILFHPKIMNISTNNGVHRTTVRSEQLS